MNISSFFTRAQILNYINKALVAGGAGLVTNGTWGVTASIEQQIIGGIMAAIGLLLSKYHIGALETAAAATTIPAALTSSGASVPVSPTKISSWIVACLLIPAAFMYGCATLTGTSDPVQQLVVVDSDVKDAVQLAAATEISHDPNSTQYFIVASEALNTLTNNGAPTLTQINAELAKVVPAQYQDIVASVTQIAADKYQQWYTANSAKLTSGNTGQYIVGVIVAARDGINAALGSSAPAATPAAAPAAGPSSYLDSSRPGSGLFRIESTGVMPDVVADEASSEFSKSSDGYYTAAQQTHERYLALWGYFGDNFKGVDSEDGWSRGNMPRQLSPDPLQPSLAYAVMITPVYTATAEARSRYVTMRQLWAAWTAPAPSFAGN